MGQIDPNAPVKQEDRADAFRRRPRPAARPITKKDAGAIAQKAADGVYTLGRPRRVEEVLLIDSSTWTGGQWNPVDAKCPEGTEFAIVMFELRATLNNDEAELYWRTSAGLGVTYQQRTAGVATPDGDETTARVVEQLVELANGKFEIYPDVIGGSPTGTVRLLGYWEPV